jgi:hypothetical protein
MYHRHTLVFESLKLYQLNRISNTSKQPIPRAVTSTSIEQCKQRYSMLTTVRRSKLSTLMCMNCILYCVLSSTMQQLLCYIDDYYRFFLAVAASSCCFSQHSIHRATQCITRYISLLLLTCTAPLKKLTSVYCVMWHAK